MGVFSAVLSAASYFAQVLVAYCLLLFGYRLLLHPLRQYPGPLLAKFSDAYGGFFAGAMRLHLVTLENHEKYGSVVRTGPNKLQFNSSTALQDIYNNERLQKSFIYTLLPNATTYPNVFNVIDKGIHRHKRRLVGQAVSDRAMRLFEPTMVQEIDVFVALLLRSCQGVAQPQPVNMTVLCKRLGVDLVGQLAFGFGLNTQTEETYRFLIKGLVAGNFKANLYLQFPSLKKLQLDALLTLLTRGQRERYYALVERMLNARLAEDVDAKADLVSFLAEGSEAVAVKDREELINILRWEGIFFFSAGSDTSSSTLCALFFYLSRSAEAYRKVATEIRSAFTSGAEIRTGPALAGCKYLRACIDEALRLSPPVTGALWREHAPADKSGAPLIIDGHVVPPGTQIGVSSYALHHNAAYFPEPFAFRPERWLTEDETALRKANAAFAPFSIGARACAGKPMAYLELTQAIARTLWYLDFEAAPGAAGELGAGSPERKDGRNKPGEYQLYDIFAATHDGPNLVFRPRGDYWKELDMKEVAK